MILDIINNGAKYQSIHPLFKKAFDFLTTADLESLPFGKIELEGSNLVVIVADLIGKTKEEARVETHNRFIDIQVPIGASETMGWIARAKLKQPTSEYNEEKDIAFFADKASNFITVKPYEFIVFFPEDGHQPGIAVGNHKKIIVKISV